MEIVSMLSRAVIHYGMGLHASILGPENLIMIGKVGCYMRRQPLCSHRLILTSGLDGI